MNNVQKQAQRDATEYARAHMSYGEGAGTRRKLIYGTVEYKMKTVPGYETAFYKAAEHQDMAQFAKEAKKAERRRAVNTAVSRNTKALLSGKYENVNTALLVVGTATYFAHRYDIDKKVWQAAKSKYQDYKFQFKKAKNRRKSGKAKSQDVHKIHSL